MVLLFALTLFLGSALLFVVEPLFAKMILPTLGGAPAVWNTCVVFYQATLLAGYLYAHFATARLGVRRQAAVHLALLFVAAIVLPIRMASGWLPPTTVSPIPWLFLLLVVSVGLPFFALSANAPLLQRWFAATPHPSARDPFFLYAASNLGSLLGLLMYPVVLEPTLRLRSQSWLWTAGYGLLIAATFACAAVVWWPRSTETAARSATDSAQRSNRDTSAGSALSTRQRLHWIVLALVPSSLMLSVTTYISTDIAPVPLLWVIPLGLYLLSFILVFARRQLLSARWVTAVLSVVTLPLLISTLTGQRGSVAVVIPLHLVTFLLVALVCHGQLAQSRPSAERLTEFYLWISVGGVAGGLFNTLIAPIIFSWTIEYPLGLAVAFILRPMSVWAGEPQRRSPIRLGVALLMLGLGVVLLYPQSKALMANGLIGALVVYGSLLLFGAVLWYHPAYSGIIAGTILLVGLVQQSADPRLLHIDRNFFGVHSVRSSADRKYRLLLHGTTLHGMQALTPDRKPEPLTYFHRQGPLGDVYRSAVAAHPELRVAVLGLGAGAMGCYAQGNQTWTFYEIDPAVERIARDPRFFTLLRDCAPGARVILGDARLSIGNAPDHAYDLIALDVFSSDAIPMHLLTREAIALYLQKLAPGGMMALHVSNQYLNLEPVVGALARDARLAGLIRKDVDQGKGDWPQDKLSSIWVTLARQAADLGALALDRRWSALSVPPGFPVWTDDFSNLLAAVNWRR